MKLRSLGQSGLLISPVCLGTMTFGTPVAADDAIDLVHFAIDHGINFFDTANVYEGYTRFFGSPGGIAEEILGRAIRDRRDKVVIATKVGAPNGPGPQDRGLSASHILREVDRSLQRLQTDYIDLYIIHWPDHEVPLATTLSALETAVRQGKVRAFGASNHNAAQLCELRWLADRHGWPAVVSSQIPLSLLKRHYHPDLAFCARFGIAVTPYQALQSGQLTGKYRRGQALPADSRAAQKPEWVPAFDDTVFDRLEALQALAAEIDVPLTQYALAWTLAQPAVAAPIVGVKSRSQIATAIAAAEVVIPPAHFARIDDICPPPWRQMDPIRG